jgi:hypothetical protein
LESVESRAVEHGSVERGPVEHGRVERGPVKSIVRRPSVDERCTNVTSASRLVEHERVEHAAVERGPVMPASVGSRVAVERGPLGTQPITRVGG